MRIVTWNINSLRLRLPLLERMVTELSPDVICLQETKVPDELFPEAAPGALGYPFHFRRGMKGYNGVAILSRVPMRRDETAPDWCLKDDRRHIAAVLETPTGPVTLHDFYVPAGGDIPDPAANPKYAHKLAFVDEAADYFAANPPARSILVGDLNIAPLEHDVWSHKQLRDVVSHTEPEIERMTRWLGNGFTDAMRHFVPPAEKLYTWWSYRNRDWRASNRGRRLDHVWVTPDLVPALRGLHIHQEARDWTGPSDHVPVAIDLAL
ncbi:exodeoxyribonuclease III [Acetobacteraceae bacterium KSS8]|uniref:Exodeoxyribonuclease III n=1 Tax=Endosaccharibacter trunci TaxID=2812733 RepID=A0ABT1W335_9PROT|nr:exodeoxyribonuclease III [Acetobacteraceae bacterium KSS8]